MNRHLKPLDFTAPSWPDATQRLLLQACLLPGEASVVAWRAWQQRVDFDDIDAGSMRLVPLLNHNLMQQGVADPDLGRYRGLVRRSWYQNQVQFQQAAGVLALFVAKGIPALLLKGVPLALLYYPAKALRPMSDFDLLVPYGETERAIAVLQAAGWNGDLNPLLRVPAPHRLQAGHAWGFQDRSGAKLDLHWRILQTSFSPDADELFWRGAETFSVAGATAHTLNATDHLLHTCIHGLPKNDVPPIRWIADAMMILRAREIDWERLLAQTQAHRTSVMMIHALTYLRDHFRAPVPDGILERLRGGPIESWEHGEFVNLTTSERPLARRLHSLSYGFLRFRRSLPTMAERFPLSAFWSYWQMRWDLTRRREIPPEAWRRLRRSIGGRLPTRASPAKGS
jgi:hypothetical protein